MKKVYPNYEYLDLDYVQFLSTPVQTQYENMVRPMLAMGADTKEVWAELSLLRVCVKMEQDVKNGKAVHFFFKGPKFYEWLRQCKTPITADQTGIFDRRQEEENSPFMLHFEGSKTPVYLCRWVQSYDLAKKEPGKNKAMVVSLGKKSRSYYYSPDGTTEDGHGANDEDTKEIGGIVASAIAYIEAFPEMVADGIPDDLKHPNHYRKMKCQTVGIAPRLIIRDGPCPHYRSGHFRLLKSERYTAKRGQVVFVHGCFVKGHAETVLGPDEAPPV